MPQHYGVRTDRYKLIYYNELSEWEIRYLPLPLDRGDKDVLVRTQVLRPGGVDRADPGRGRFRSYLLGALKHFLAERRRDERREKRGGGVVIRSIDSGGTDSSPGMAIPDPAGQLPDASFDREWALALMERGLTAVQEDFEGSGKARHFEVLKPWLVGETENLSREEAAAQLDMTPAVFALMVEEIPLNH